MPARRSNRGGWAKKFTDPDGVVWDSPLEWYVYTGLQDLGYSVRRCDERDAISYHTPVKQGRCLECGSSGTVQDRIYTPDLHVVEPQSKKRGLTRRAFIVECKGRFPQDRRSMLRCVKEQHPSLDLRFLFGSEKKLTPKRTNVEYVRSMIKCPAGVWVPGKDIKWRYPNGYKQP